MNAKNQQQKPTELERQLDIYRVSPILITSFNFSLFEGQLAVITFFSGIPADPPSQVVVEAGVGSFALTKRQAQVLAKELLKFAEAQEGGTPDET